jgi:hypothetical protein
MPLFDRMCRTCGWARADLLEKHDIGTVLCPQGHATERVWVGRHTTMIPDDFPGGRVYENLGHTPRRIYSRSELKRVMAQEGVMPFVRHQPLPGTDKSPHTTPWSSMSQETLDNAKALLERLDEK